MGDEDDAFQPAPEKASARKKKKKQNNRVKYLPQELASIILLHVPAQALQNVMRHVCREWNLLINAEDFIYNHLRNNSIGGLLLRDITRPNGHLFVEMRGDSIEISRSLDCGRVLNSCNGLILTHGPHGRNVDGVPSVVNPLTNKGMNLPPYHRRGETWWDFAIAFAESSMEYKVVGSHKMEHLTSQRATEISVLTVGADRVWRDICVDHLTLTKRAKLWLKEPHVAGGYMHWVGGTYILTLNVETEELCEFALPRYVRSRSHFLPMGSKLSAVDMSRKRWTYIWEMNSANGEWKVLHCLKHLPLHFYEVFGWLVPGEVLVVETGKNGDGDLDAYNFKTSAVRSFEMAHDQWARARPHVNSLVWW